MVVEKAEIQWPALSKKPNEKSMTVNIVIGRDGRVKEASTYSPVGNDIEDAALTAIRKWKFQPQNVEGVPAQAETSLTIPFPADYQNLTANQPQVKPMFDRARAINDLRLEGAPGFHLKASFHSEDNSAKGTYEETWVSPNKWRREVKLNETSVLEVRTEDSFYRIFPGKYAPRLADDVMESLSFSLPGDNGGDLHDADWSAVNANLGNLPLLRLSNGYINPQNKPDALTLIYFVDEKTALIRGRYHFSSVTIFNDLQSFEGKMVARKLTLMGADISKLDINIDTLERNVNPDENIFSVAGVKPLYTSAEEDVRFTQPHAVHTVNPSIPGWHGRVTCGLSLDQHGHVRDVDVKGNVDESVIRPIRTALMGWEYEPATMNGRPSLGFVQVIVAVNSRSLTKYEV